MFACLIILILNFSVQDTSLPTRQETISAASDSIPKKKKRKKQPRADTPLVLQQAVIVAPPDSVHFYKEKKPAFYWGQISDTSHAVANMDDLLTEGSEYREAEVQTRRKKEDRSWIFYIMMAPVLIFVYVRLNFYKYLKDLFRAFFNLTITQQFYREQELSMTFSAFLLNANFVLTGGMYIYLVADYFHLDKDFSDIMFWALCGGLLASVYLTKYIFLRLTAFFFPVAGRVNYYNFNVFLFNKVLGIFLILFVLVMSFANPVLKEPVLYVSLFILFFFFLYRYFRGFLIAGDYVGFQKFHFFIYLCTLEVAPILILVKLLTAWAKV